MRLESRGNYFQGFGEINVLFSEIKGAQNPPGGLISYLEIENGRYCYTTKLQENGESVNYAPSVWRMSSIF